MSSTFLHGSTFTAPSDMSADTTGVAGQQHALVQLFQATGIPST
ncbi:hypothetical protein I552_5778 [Mycobacterium xenopi 3993]|nr:hypothetical protein I552_5778 [Mycobacterium xenopi 3993]